jgi:hypothetical protein
MNAFSASFRSHGTTDRWWNGGGLIDRHSIVVASLTELKQPQGEPLDFPHLGAAIMYIANIVPGDDHVVHFRCFIDWRDDLDVRISWIVY